MCVYIYIYIYKGLYTIIYYMLYIYIYIYLICDGSTVNGAVRRECGCDATRRDLTCEPRRDVSYARSLAHIILMHMFILLTILCIHNM